MPKSALIEVAIAALLEAFVLHSLQIRNGGPGSQESMALCCRGAWEGHRSAV